MLGIRKSPVISFHQCFGYSFIDIPYIANIFKNIKFFPNNASKNIYPRDIKVGIGGEVERYSEPYTYCTYKYVALAIILIDF